MRLALLYLSLHGILWQSADLQGPLPGSATEGQLCDGVCKQSCDDGVGGVVSGASCPYSGQSTPLDFLASFTADYDEQTCVEIQSLCIGRVISLSGDFCRDRDTTFTIDISGVNSGDIAMRLSMFLTAERLTLGHNVGGNSRTHMVNIDPFPFTEKTFDLRFTVDASTILIESYEALTNDWRDISTFDIAPNLDLTQPYQICRQGCGIVMNGVLDVVAGSKGKGQPSTTSTMCTQPASIKVPAPASGHNGDTCVDIGPLCEGRSISLNVFFDNYAIKCMFQIDFRSGKNVAMRLLIGFDSLPEGQFVSVVSIISGMSQNKAQLGQYIPFMSQARQMYSIHVDLYQGQFYVSIEYENSESFQLPQSLTAASINRLCVSGCGHLDSVTLGTMVCLLDTNTDDAGDITASGKDAIVEVKKNDGVFPPTAVTGQSQTTQVMTKKSKNCGSPASNGVVVDSEGCVKIGPLCSGKVIEVSGTYCAGASFFTIAIQESSNPGNSPLTMHLDTTRTNAEDAHTVKLGRMINGHTKDMDGDMTVRFEEGDAYTNAFVVADFHILIDLNSDRDFNCSGTAFITDNFITSNDYTLCVQNDCSSLETVNVGSTSDNLEKYGGVVKQCISPGDIGDAEFGGSLFGGYEYDANDDTGAQEGPSEALRWANVTLPELTPAATLTYVGLSLSILCLIIAVVLQFRNGTVKQTPGKIIVSLTLSLAAAQFLFMFLDMPYGNDVVCRTIAIIEHLLWLYAFSWSNVMVIDLVRVISDSTPKLHRTKSNCYLFYCGVSSVIPLSIIVTSVLLDHFTEWFQYGYPGNCWISPDSARHYLFILPIAVSVALNITLLLVLFVVIRKIQRTTQALGDDSFMSNRRGAIIGLKLSSVMGITWVFGFLGDFLNNDILIFLFTVLNVFQGIMVFFGLSYNHTYVTRWVRAKVCGNQSQPDVVTETTRTSSVARENTDGN